MPFSPEQDNVICGAPRVKARACTPKWVMARRRGSSTSFGGRNPSKHTLLRSFGASKGTLPAFIHGLKTLGFLRRRANQERRNS